MKKMLLTLAVALGISSAAPVFGAAATPDIKLRLDGQVLEFTDAKPYVLDGRTLVPVRFVSEKLGATVQWDDATRTVKIDKAGKQIALRIGEKKATVDGKQIAFDAAAMIQDSRTFVPLRFVSEAYGAQVVWDRVYQTVHIITKPKVRDAYGTELFKQFHSSLKIKDGIITGKLPRKSDENLLVNFQIGFNNGKPGEVKENGESFSYKVSEIRAFGFLVYDRAHGKILVDFSYRCLPDLTALDVADR